MRAKQGMEAKLNRYLDEHPGSDLTYRQIAERFNVSIQWARTKVGQMVASGEVESIHVIRRKQGGKT